MSEGFIYADDIFLSFILDDLPVCYHLLFRPEYLTNTLALMWTETTYRGVQIILKVQSGLESLECSFALPVRPHRTSSRLVHLGSTSCPVSAPVKTAEGAPDVFPKCAKNTQSLEYLSLSCSTNHSYTATKCVS